MRFARVSRDANHLPIVHGLRKAGYSVLDLAAVGQGAPDALVGGNGVSVLMEFKNPDNAHGRGGKMGLKMNARLERQAAWHAAWRGAPVVVIRSIEEAIAAMEAAR